MKLIILALAPAVIIAVFIYFRDRYEKEPIHLLLKSLGAGILIVIPVIFVEKGVSSLIPFLPEKLEA